ncbi:MAG: hypothetical protein S4CHLAM81_02420 [Chlamydiales bacterium]|nr:hypothetical protein [Chlamydiales bacterium]MCH9635034.1 hypothetical protein [Chlamydiales bacterium]
MSSQITHSRQVSKSAQGVGHDPSSLAARRAKASPAIAKAILASQTHKATRKAEGNKKKKKPAAQQPVATNSAIRQSAPKPTAKKATPSNLVGGVNVITLDAHDFDASLLKGTQREKTRKLNRFMKKIGLALLVIGALAAVAGLGGMTKLSHLPQLKPNWWTFTAVVGGFVTVVGGSIAAKSAGTLALCNRAEKKECAKIQEEGLL